MRIFSWSCTGAQPENFQDRDVFSEYGHFDKRLFYGIPKNFPAVGNFFFFSPSTLKIAFLNDNLNHRRTRTGHFVCKIWHFFQFSKKVREDPPANCAPDCTSRITLFFYKHQLNLIQLQIWFTSEPKIMLRICLCVSIL